VSLRGRWRILFITLSAALAVFVPLGQFAESTTTSERAAAPPSSRVAGSPLPSAPSLASPAGPAVSTFPVQTETGPVATEPGVEAAPAPAPETAADETLPAPVVAEFTAATAVGRARPVPADGRSRPATNQATPAPVDVQPRSGNDRTALPVAGTSVNVAPVVATPVGPTQQATALSPTSAHPNGKKTLPGQDRPKRTKTEHEGRGRED
jgi:hypothetical protein